MWGRRKNLNHLIRDGDNYFCEMSLKREYTQDSWSLLDSGQTIVTIKETIEENTVRVQVSGSLRSDTEHYFQDELIALSTVGKDIVVDCKEIQYMANACQLALLNVQQRMDSMRRGSLTLCNVPPEIYADFEKTNLHELLMIE